MSSYQVPHLNSLIKRDLKTCYLPYQWWSQAIASVAKFTAAPKEINFS